MKKFFTLFLLIIISGVQVLFAQTTKQVSAVSKKVYISITKPAQQIKVPENNKIIVEPPYLEITNYNFSDDNGNNKIDAGETVKITFDLSNSGNGTATGLNMIIEEKNEVKGINFIKSNNLPELKKGESKHIEIPIEGSLYLPDDIASFRIIIDEPNGFGTDPLEVEIETQAFRPPMVKMVDYQVSSQAAHWKNAGRSIWKF